MDLYDIKSRCNMYDQLYLELVLKGCRQLQNAMLPRFDRDSVNRLTFESDYQLQAIVDSTLQRQTDRDTDSETRAFSYNTLHTDSSMFSSGDGDHVTDQLTVPILKRANCQLSRLIRSDLTVLKKLRKKRKTVFHQLDTAKHVTLDPELTACQSDVMRQEILTKADKNLHKYKLYQDDEVVCRETIVQKLEEDVTLTETHEPSLALIINRLAKLVQDILGTRLSISMSDASGKSYESLLSTPGPKGLDIYEYQTQTMKRPVDYNMFLASSYKTPPVGELLPTESGYKRVIKAYQPTGPRIWELPLFIGQLVKQKGGANSEGIAYGSRRGTFGGIRSGYFPAICVTSV